MVSRKLAWIAIAGGVLLGCSSSGGGTKPIVGSGGSPGTGGGSTATGGATTASGGATATGGAIGSGGTTPTGGMSAIGGATGSGGTATPGTGGAGQGGGGATGAGGGAAGGAAPLLSAGCGQAAPTPTGMIGTTQYGKFSLSITAQSVLSFNRTPGQNQAIDRLYYVRLPDGYDPTKPYRVIYVGPGCGLTQDTQATPKGFTLGTDIANSTGAKTQAIVVQLEPGTYNPAAYNPANCRVADTSGCNATSQYCFDDWASETGTPAVSRIPDVTSGAVAMERAYFDALHKKIEASYCVDKGRQFYAGYSSGGWLAQQLGCWFPDVLRAQANVTGGIPPILRDNALTGANDYCVKHPIAAFLIHSNPDVSNGFQGSVDASRRLFALNGCTGAVPGGTVGPPLPGSQIPAGLASYTIAGVPASMIPGAPNTADFQCYRYATCPASYPMVFCVSSSAGHQDQKEHANPAFWEFFSKF